MGENVSGKNFASKYSVEANDPSSELVDRSGYSADDLNHVGEVMAAMGRLRDIERKASEASQRYMQLNETDMKALHYLMLAENRDEVVTASTLSRFLEITTASVTKMLDRLEEGKHIKRLPHPNDRRSICIVITPETRLAAKNTVGRFQASRFRAAAELGESKRQTVIDFLNATASDLEQSLHFLTDVQ